MTQNPGRMVAPDVPVRTFGRVQEIESLPNLTEIQTEAYEAFLGADTPPGSRPMEGLEALLHEVFPI